MDTAAAVPSDGGFNVAYVRAEPGKGTGPHTHPVVEAFIPVTGRWAVYWGEGDAREQLELGPLDCSSVPPGVVRGFTNISDGPALLIAIVGGTGREGVDWAQELLDSAAADGWRLAEGGKVVRE
jgi:quercetin dioxygenase-like cupin family protein